MRNEEDAEELPTERLCLRVAAELEPSALPRILHQFQNLNIIPRRVIAERDTAHTLHIRVDIVGLTEDRLTLIASKVGQLPGVGNAYWHRL